MSANINKSTMDTVQASMSEAYESLQSLKNLVGSYAKNSEVLKKLNDVLFELKIDIKNTNDIYKDEEKNIKSLMSQVYEITNEQKHISLKIPAIIRQLDQNETVQVMQSFDNKAQEYQGNLEKIVSQMTEMFDTNFNKWNNSTSYLDYSNYVKEVKQTHQDIVAAFNELDLSQLNKSLDITLEKINKNIKDVIDVQNEQLNGLIQNNSSNQEYIIECFQKIFEYNEGYLKKINDADFKNQFESTKKLLVNSDEKSVIELRKIETSINNFKATVETRVGALSKKVEDLEKSIANIQAKQDGQFNQLQDMLSEMINNQKIILEQTKKKGWFS